MFFIPIENWSCILSRLKLRPCPHCQSTGNLNAHGYLRGYGEGSTRIIRGRRIFCSNRGRNKGCGKTHSLTLPSILPSFQFLANILWQFLSLILLGNTMRHAFLKSFGYINTSRPYSLWKRCTMVQPQIRHRLTLLCHPPPSLQKNPFLQVIEHLTFAFPHSTCPISTYQEYFRFPFLS